MRALIVDNHIDTRFRMEQLLSRCGYEYVTAADGEEAWQLFQNNPFNIVISEWHLPGLEGYELCQKIRSLELENYAYFIFCSTAADAKNVESGIEVGADYYVGKSLGLDQLRTRLLAVNRHIASEQQLIETNRRLKSELQQAAVTIKNLLPVKRNEADLKIDWLFKPCTEIGGDLFSVFSIDEQNLGLYAFDVSGHSVASALFADTLGNMLVPRKSINGQRNEANLENPSWNSCPIQVASTLNDRFPIEEHMQMYATMFYAVINRKDFTMRWVRAAHPPAIVSSFGSLKLLAEGDPPLGFFQGYPYTEHVTQLNPGDRLFLYSDGILETTSTESGELFGIKRLRALIKKATAGKFENIIKTVEQEITQFRGNNNFEDDMSLLALEIGTK